MRTMIAAMILGAGAGAAAAETRCGWIDNPTPANWWLTDAEGQWTIMTQGGSPPPGMDLIPDLTVGEWVATNGSYGYGCGCMEVVTDAGMQITEIRSFAQKPVAACANDPALEKR